MTIEFPSFLIYEIGLIVKCKQIPHLRLICRQWNEILQKNIFEKRYEDPIDLIKFYNLVERKISNCDEKTTIYEISPFTNKNFDLSYFQRIFEESWCKAPKLDFYDCYADYVNYIRPKHFPKGINLLQGFVHLHRKYYSVKFNIYNNENHLLFENVIVNIFQRYDDNSIMLCFDGFKSKYAFVYPEHVTIKYHSFFIYAMLKLFDKGISKLKYKNIARLVLKFD